MPSLRHKAWRLTIQKELRAGSCKGICTRCLPLRFCWRPRSSRRALKGKCAQPNAQAARHESALAYLLVPFELTQTALLSTGEVALFAARDLAQQSVSIITDASTSFSETLASAIRFSTLSSAGSSSLVIASPSHNQCSCPTRSIRPSLTTRLLNKHR